MKTYNQISQIIDKAKSILVITKEKITIDELCASLVLTSKLDNITNDKRVTLILGANPTTNTTKIINRFSGLNTSDRRIPKLTVITIDNKDKNLAGIEWKEENDVVKCLISTKDNEEISKDKINLETETETHGLIITVGLDQLEDLGELYNNSRDFFHKTTILNLRTKSDSNEVGDFEIQDSNASSYSEIVYETLKSFKVNYTKEEASVLLLGIYEATQYFKQIKNPKTFNTASLLTALEADINWIDKFLMDSKAGKLEEISTAKTEVEEEIQIVKSNRKRTTKGTALFPKKSQEPARGEKTIQEVVKEKAAEISAAAKPVAKTPKIKAETPTPTVEKVETGVKEATKKVEPTTPTNPKNNSGYTPLKKASSVPQMPPSTEGQQSFQSPIGSPNFVQPPPIVPGGNNSSNYVPLSPKKG